MKEKTENLISRKQASTYVLKELIDIKRIIIVTLVLSIVTVATNTLFIKFALVMPLMAYLGIKLNQKHKYKEQLEEKYGVYGVENEPDKQ